MTWKEKMAKGRKLNEKMAYIVNDYESGTPLQRIAAKHQISFSWIRQRLKKIGILRPGGNRTPHLVGRKFGSLRVIRKLEKRDKNGFTVWECVCECGRVCQRAHYRLKNIQSCGCKMHNPRNGGKKWKETCDLRPDVWSVILRNANIRDLEVKITLKDAWNIFIHQDGMCALSGMPIFFGEVSGSPRTASLDRIDSKMGYTLGNLQWVHKDLNRMKGALTDENFISICRMVVSHADSKKS